MGHPSNLSKEAYLSSRNRWDAGEQDNFAMELALRQLRAEAMGRKLSFVKLAMESQKEVIMAHRRHSKGAMTPTAMKSWLPEKLVAARDKLRSMQLDGVGPIVNSSKEEKTFSGLETLERLEARIKQQNRQIEDMHQLLMEVLTSQAVSTRAFPLELAQAAKTFERHSVALIGLKGDKEVEIRKAYDGMHKLQFVHSKKGHVDFEHMHGVQHIFSIRGLNDGVKSHIELKTGRKIMFVESMDELRQRLNALAIQRT